MLIKNKWDEMDELEKAFKCGIMVTAYIHAVDTISHCYLILSENIDNKSINHWAWFRADAALVKLLGVDLSILPEIDAAREFSTYLPNVRVTVGLYAALRNQKNYISPVDEMESSVQKALLKSW